MSWHRDGSHCDRPKDCAALTDRRQRATEAFDDAMSNELPSTMTWASTPLMRAEQRLRRARDTGIETATTIKMTADIFEAYVAAREALNREQAHGRPPRSGQEKITAGLIAAFRAAGFEVEE